MSFYSQIGLDEDSEVDAFRKTMNLSKKNPKCTGKSFSLRKCSESLFSEQLCSEFEKELNGEEGSHLTLLQFSSMSKDDKIKLNNRVRQWALKVKEHLPRDHGLYCFVTDHLLRNAHREFNFSSVTNIQRYILERRQISEESKEKLVKDFKEANKKVRLAGELMKKNRTDEHKHVVQELHNDYGTLHNMSTVSGLSVKTVQKYCSEKKKENS